MFLIICAVAAIIPMSVYLSIIWWLDKYEREPFKYVFYCFAYGAVGAIILSYLLSSILTTKISFFSGIFSNPLLAGALIIAPLTEEVTKGIFLFTRFIYNKIDNLTDGLVYGGAIGLGFGMTENFLYFLYYGTDIKLWISLVIIRTVFSAVMHCLSTSTFGAFLSLAKFGNKPVKLLFPIIGIFTSMSIHFLWNYSVSIKDMFLYGFIFILLTIFIFGFLFYMSLNNEKKLIINELNEEAALNYIPADHINFFKYSKKNQNIRIDESTRKKYIYALSKLAFTKMQFKNSAGIYKSYYAGEIENCRLYIQSLLNKSV